jgi:hypothetical protein
MWYPVDFPMPSEHFVQRTLTPQATSPQTQGVQIPFAWRSIDYNGKADLVVSGQAFKASTLARVQKRNAGIAFSPSSGLWFSVLFNEELAAVRNARDATNERGPLSEEFQTREAVARVGLDLLNNIKLGIGIRSQAVRGDVVGSFFVGAQNRVVYSGSRLGVVGAVLVDLTPVKIALRHETPVAGKVDIQGESKVSSTLGYTGGALKFAVNSEAAVFAEYGYYTASRNELASSVRASNSTNNSLFILPLGTAIEARVVPLSVIGAGVAHTMSSVLKLQLDVAQGKMYASSDPELLVPSTVPDDQKQKVNAVRLGLEVEKGDWESQIFADYGQSKISYRADANNKVDRSHSYWGIGLRAGVEL